MPASDATTPSPVRSPYGLEEARARLPHIAAEAVAGHSSVITRHGKPVAVVVPVAQWEAQQAEQAQAAKRARAPGILALRGSGAGLWARGVAQEIQASRGEWSPDPDIADRA